MATKVPAARSSAVTAVGILTILMGVLHSLGCTAAAALIGYVTFFLSVSSGAFGGAKSPPAQPPFHLLEAAFPYMTGLFLTGLLIGLLFVSAGVGLLKRRRWAWALSLLLAGLTGLAAAA